MDGSPKRRSVIVSGHRTSVSVESEFWNELVTIASDHGQSINSLVSEIDAARSGSLSAAIRLYVLKTLKSRVRQYASSTPRPPMSG